jgi:asparagine synthase (glutamine-hydrolysing)
MIKCLVHESFYVSGKYCNEALGLSAGWAAAAGGFDAAMPVWNEKRDVCLIFSGEDFADGASLDLLKAKGHDFDRETASYLVHLYEESGPEFLEKINGWFSGLVVDLREQRILLFNDRYGVNRIYFCESEGRFYFASEPKALLSVLPSLRALDMQSVGEFFSCSCILQNRSLFRGVTALPGASVLTFAPGRETRKSVYFRKEVWENQPLLGAEDYYARLKETWLRVLPRYFGGKEKVGLSLTGGVDSRMMLAWAPLAEGSLPCYTFGGRYRDCADVSLSRRIAGICHQPHQIIPLGAEFLAQFPVLADETVYLSDGAMDVTGAADLYVQRLLRKIAPVRVNGVYGGEILRNLVTFKPGYPCAEVLAPELAAAVHQAAATYATEAQGRRLSFIAFKQAAWQNTTRFSVERSQITLRTPYFDNELVALAYQAAPESQNVDNALRLVAEGRPALQGVGTDRGLVLGGGNSLDYARHLFQQFTFKAEYAYDYGMPQWVCKLDHLAAPLHLERLFLGRHKFHHFRVFYRDELANYLKEMLLDERSLGRPYLSRVGLEKIVKAHTSGWGNYTTELSKVLTLELVQRRLIEQA